MPEIAVNLPTFHRSQAKAYLAAPRFMALRCGRRWGKTKFGTAISVDRIIKGQTVGWFAPEHKFLIEPYQEMMSMLGDAVSSSSEQKGQIHSITGGHVDVWSLDNKNAGRGRKYHLVIVDEAAFAKTDLIEQWRRNIRPTLVDYRGDAIICSNTNGADTANFFWQICNQPNHGFRDFHAPSSSNPHLPKQELEELKNNSHPQVWRQEYLAEFVDWRGVAFFSVENWLWDGHPIAYPARCDAIYATVDTAAKTGRLNDGTGVIYWAYVRNPISGPNLYILDYDLVKIEGALLETWLPTVVINCEGFARRCGAKHGSIGAFIEDKSSGTVLLQQAIRRDMPVRPIDSKLTALGKSERAINVSGYHHRNQIKITQPAMDRTLTYNEIHQNHLVGQVTGFRVGAKDDKAEDDLLDCYCYGISVSLGNVAGF